MMVPIDDGDKRNYIILLWRREYLSVKIKWQFMTVYHLSKYILQGQPVWGDWGTIDFALSCKTRITSNLMKRGHSRSFSLIQGRDRGKMTCMRTRAVWGAMPRSGVTVGALTGDTGGWQV